MTYVYIIEYDSIDGSGIVAPYTQKHVADKKAEALNKAAGDGSVISYSVEEYELREE